MNNCLQLKNLNSSHLSLAHDLWRQHLKGGDWVIDATCGRGQDTLKIAQILEAAGGIGGILAIDIQAQAIEETQTRLPSTDNIYFFQQSHATFPHLAYEHPIALITYNLGYLPSGDKALTTQTPSTLCSLQAALEIAPAISITCYPGHDEGQKEEEAILNWVYTLSLLRWNVEFYKKEGSATAPSLFWICSSQREKEG